MLSRKIVVVRQAEAANTLLLTIKTLSDEGKSCVLVNQRMGFALGAVDYVKSTDWAGKKR